MGETRYILSVTILMIHNYIIAMKSSHEHLTRFFSTQAPSPYQVDHLLYRFAFKSNWTTGCMFLFKSNWIAGWIFFILCNTQAIRNGINIGISLFEYSEYRPWRVSPTPFRPEREWNLQWYLKTIAMLWLISSGKSLLYCVIDFLFFLRKQTP